MDANELMAHIRKLRRLIVEAKGYCGSNNHNHWPTGLAKLSEAESMAYDLEVETEIRLGEELLSRL